MAVYFKFSSWNQKVFDTIPLDSGAPFISVGELKQQIIRKKKLNANTGLVVTNAQTNEGNKFAHPLQSVLHQLLFFLPNNSPPNYTRLSNSIEYADDNALVQKNTSVLVKIVPVNTTAPSGPPQRQTTR